MYTRGDELSITNYYVSNGIIIFLSLFGIVTLEYIFKD